MKTLIVDCGATKTLWCTVEDGSAQIYRTHGFNLAHTPADVIEGIVAQAAEKTGSGVDIIYFYGAALVGKSPVDLTKWFPGATVEYASDMLGAARATLGREKGIAAIIGTGANTCLYDGEKATWKVDCGGFILGDEGSAAVLGKLFVADFIKNRVPEPLANEFREQFGADYPALVKNVYSGTAPARYLGTFAPFITGHYHDSGYARELVDGNFRSFFQKTLLQYPSGLPVGVVGGFGYAARDILTRMGREYGISFKTFIENPMEGLVSYHAI